MKKNKKAKTIQNKVFRLGELFCGPGGLAVGALNAKVKTKNGIYRIEHAWANDYDHDSCETYIQNICKHQPETVFTTDVKYLNIENLPSIEGFAYGFPCNDFSVVGEQKGLDGKFGPLYSYGVKVLNYHKPKFFVAENVSGLSGANGNKAFAKILSDLESAGNGYTLTAHLYKAELYGIPQRRHRIVIVGIDRKFKLAFKVPAPTTSDSPRTAKQALEDPPIPKDAENNELTNQSATVIQRLEKTRPGENAWTSNLPDNLKLNVKGARLSQIYKRLDPDKPSYTITGSGGGGTHGYHWDEPRALTNRERARIQSFSDTFIFLGSKESVRRQIGMAVPPVLSRVIFSAILKTLAGKEYKSVPSNISHQLVINSNY